MQRGDRILIKDNLVEIMMELKFEEHSVISMQPLIGTEQTIYDIWVDKGVGIFVTIDLCCEVPMQCCEVIN